MLGRLLCSFLDEESHASRQRERLLHEGALGEGPARARNWQRHDLGGNKKGLPFTRASTPTFRTPAHSRRTSTTRRSRSAPRCATAARLTLPSSARALSFTLVSATSLVEGGAMTTPQGLQPAGESPARRVSKGTVPLSHRRGAVPCLVLSVGNGRPGMDEKDFDNMRRAGTDAARQVGARPLAA